MATRIPLLPGGGVPSLDFSSLGRLPGEVMQARRQNKLTAERLQDIAEARGDRERQRAGDAAFSSLVQSGDFNPSTAQGLTSLGQAALGLGGARNIDRGMGMFAQARAIKDSELDRELARARIAKARAPTRQEFGLNPVYGTGPDGEPVIFQLSKDGNVKRVELPDGSTVSTGIKKVDLGDSTAIIDQRSGKALGVMPKNLAEAEAEKARGKDLGEAQAGLDSLLADSQVTIGLIDELKAHPGKEVATGLSGRFDPRNYIAGSDAANFEVRRKQLIGRTFLEAIGQLRGTGQITEVEGQKAQDAIARLSRAQDTPEFDVALDDFKAVIESGMKRARSKAKGQDRVPQGGGVGGTTQGGVQWSVK